MDDDELIGTTLGGCQITGLLGQGGMARVYRAYQEHLEREVAIKVLPPYSVADPTFVERFQLEARAMAKLHHPNIATIYDAGEQRPWLFIVMELITGGNLRQRMQHAMPITEAAHIIHQIADALSYAHERGIIHRDVKPVNVLLDNSGGEAMPRAVLTDFGIAKVLETSAQLTRTGAGVGTPEYMSPEQCKGGTVDQRTDIYALGVMLYEVLCGRPPFMADEFTAIAHSHIYEPVPPPTLFNPQISAPIQAVIAKALQKRPENRFSSARELAQALDEAVTSNHTMAPSRPITVTCSNCGTANPVGMNFCSRCGANLRGGPSAQLPQVALSQVGAVTCPSCSTMNPSTNRYCIRCGTRLMSMTCPHCGRPVAMGQRFCVACGQAISPGNMPQA